MNDHELDLALDAIGTSRTQVSASPVLRDRVRVVPLEIPQRRSWLPHLTGRFGSMFSATKFVVAGAIVALFGGFLLAGVLTQLSEEAAPAANTSMPGTFSPAGSLAETRTDHTATLLPDGGVLIVGGGDDGPRVALAEIWDPASESFSDAGLLTEDRGDHTATLLPDGRVLIVGGLDFDRVDLEYVFRYSAEIWDPATKALSPTSSLEEARAGHTATLLPDGRVLIIGGEQAGQDGEGKTRHASAEIWDPATGSFSRADTLNEARTGHTATLLPDGRVLVVGGAAPGPTRRISAEVWDPETETFSRTRSLGEARTGHTATLLPDGRVLIVGGRYQRCCGKHATAEIWDPTTDTFDATGSLAVERDDHSAVLLPGGRVLIVGGQAEGNRGNSIASAEVWDPSSASFTSAGSQAEPLEGQTATLLADGRVLVVAGDTAEVWAPASRMPPSAEESVDASTTTPDLLPGVDLVTEEVEPGVYRVLGDQAGHELEGVHIGAIEVGPDGSVWLDAERIGIFELGVPGDHRVRGRWRVGDDGTLWMAGGPSGLAPNARSFDGNTWTDHPWWPADDIVDFAFHPDGTVWQLEEDDGDTAFARLQHLGPQTRATYSIGDGLPDFGCGVDCGGGWNVDITPDGTVWLGVTDGGLLRFDGTEWEVVRPLGGDEDHGVLGMASNSDGVLWVELDRGGSSATDGSRSSREHHLARFDDESWEAFSWIPQAEQTPILAVGPDGAVWLTDAYSDEDHEGRRAASDPRRIQHVWLPVSFDGERWRRYPEIPLDRAGDPRNEEVEYVLGASQIAVGPDGTAWVTVDAWGGAGGLYVITPTAVATSE